VILHLLPRAEWEALAPDEDYLPATYAADGFVHCSGTDEVMLAVANACYGDVREELVVWDIDEASLSSDVRWEAPDPAPPPGAPAGTRFPHVYGPIDRRAVARVRRLVLGPDGGPAFVGYAPID
jgi:uncharacterized protein (DUF952 family)